METFQEQTVVITGAASGIGRACAVAFAGAGATVIAVDRDEVGLTATLGLLAEPQRDRARTVVCDIGDPAAREGLVADVGALDVLVNAAGIIRLTPIDEVTVDEWRLVHTVNAESTFFLCQRFSKLLADGGAIVNLASTAAKTGSTLEAAPYAASKASVLSVTRAFAFHLAGRGITVNAICPGVIDTPMQDQVKSDLAAAKSITVDEIEQRRGALVPLGRAGSADEVAWLIRWLAGPEARYLTGQAINICGGLVTW